MLAGVVKYWLNGCQSWCIKGNVEVNYPIGFCNCDSHIILVYKNEC